MKKLSKISYYGLIVFTIMASFILLYHFFTSDDAKSKGFMAFMLVLLALIVGLIFPSVRKQYKQEMKET
jgi:hypothetical protein